MPRQPIGSENIRKLNRLGGMTYSLTLPIHYIRELGWQQHQKLSVTKQGKKLIIEDWEA